MRKTSFIKKATVWSLCAALILPVGTMAEEEPVRETAEEESAVIMTEEESVRETAEEESAAMMTEEEIPETAATGEESGKTAAGEEAAEVMTEEESSGETSAEENTSTGYVLKRFTLYNEDEATIDIDNLKAELDFASVDDVSGIRFLIGSEDTEAGYIAVSHMGDIILIELHGGLSGQTAKYKIDSETLTTILDSDDFHLFLRGASDGENGSESLERESETESAGQGAESEVSEMEQESEPKSAGQETESGIPETDMTEEEQETEMKSAGQETESEVSETEQESETKADSQETEAGIPETDMTEEEQETEPGTGTSEFMINGLSLTSFVRLANEAYLLISEGAVKNEEVESDQGTFHRSGIVLNREHMRRLLEICSALGIDGGLKERLEAQNIQPEGGALLWGADKEDYKAVAGSFGVSVKGGKPVWNAFGADIVGKELTIYNYRMPEQQGTKVESGVEIVFGMTDPEDGSSWVPVDDTDAVNLAELEPDEAIDEISADIQTVLYDMMGSVLSVVLEEVPEEMVSDMLGLESEEETVSESESETEENAGEMAGEDASNGSEEETVSESELETGENAGEMAGEDTSD